MKEQRIPSMAGVSITPVQQMISSCSGALVTSLFVTPLDVIKVRLQAQDKPSAVRSHGIPSSRHAQHEHWRSKSWAYNHVTPLDVVKIRLQSQQKMIQKGSCFIYSNGLMDHVCSVTCVTCSNGNGNGMATAAASAKEWYARPAHFSGTFDAFVKIARYEGVSSLWSGLPPTLVMAVPATIVYFTTYDQIKYKMGYRESDPNTKYIPVLAGSTARVLTTTLISPMELVRTKMQSEQLSYRQVGVAIRHAMEQGGVMSLMRGLGPTLLRDVPFSALYWYGYEYTKALQMRMSTSTETTFFQSFVAGAISGTVASVLTLPFDVVKTHRQIELGEAQNLKTQQLSSTWKIIQRLYAQQGAKGLFTGLTPRILKVAPACAIMISSYEFGKNFFRHRNASQMALPGDITDSK